MLDKNQELFASFQKIHDLYVLEPQKYQEQFNQEGAKAVEVIKRYEDRLCSHSEKGIYGKFSANLAEKFWEEAKKHYPKLDFVGLKIIKAAAPDPFEVKKINFS
ncbi:hypothetical protein A2160_01785 [Candidatus Beckwithbacteria bacterium RBG_13_42_9]|uniref:Uncharacterized protein n=1 Tax=Candidatus Beckwithbacteria bacterium RBG_13_42_9 TaxID=1797457 RepID=A0A1F5E8L2_9BACT|nr:MAG: hypothetical protein A2160_01785 [Candidatus Beckwithbacteria bacterium RBG_13_42_9]